MTKLALLMSLHNELSDLPHEEVEERLNFYSEMIEDRMEEGLSEEEAVAAVGTVDEIAAQIIADISATNVPKVYSKPKRRMKAWEIVLLAVGSPIWLSLLIAVIAVLLSLYISMWAVIVSLWAVFGSLIGSALGVAVMGIEFIIEGSLPAGIAAIGAGIVCVGLSIFAFFGCKAATNGALLLTKKLALCIKRCFARREEVS